ncbi:MAG: sugar phosphate isomerase/epimerase [Planctomycetia bacterium]|nr:sugar phosphate isomerase/epimerase [Planctomycetia bacterium]
MNNLRPLLHSAVTVSLVPEVRGGPFVFWDDLPTACASAARLGFDAIEVFPPSSEAVDITRLRSLLKENGLALAAVGTGAGWVKHRLALTSPDASIREKAKAFVCSIIELAGSFGAPAIIGSMQGRHGDGLSATDARKYLRDALAELGTRAQAFNAPLLYEPLNRYETNLANTLAAGVDLIRDLPNVLLLADLFHMHIEEDNSASALRAAKGYIGHVHFVDTNRKPAGMGQMSYAPIAEALRAIGYERYLSAEAFSYPDAERAARQTIETFHHYFR